MNVILDVINNFTAKKFWDTDDVVNSILTELNTTLEWSSSIEQFEYNAYILELVALKLRDFDNISKDIWEPLLKFDFNSNSYILENKESEKYALLANYYPLTDTLKECKSIVSKINTLIKINTETCGVISSIHDECKYLYELLVSNISNIDQPSEYMSYIDIMNEIKKYTLASLNFMISLENISSNNSNADTITRLSSNTNESLNGVSQNASSNNTTVVADTETSAVIDEIATSDPAEPEDTLEDIPEETIEENVHNLNDANNLSSLEPLDMTNPLTNFDDMPKTEAPAPPTIMPEDKINQFAVKQIIEGGDFDLKQYTENFGNIHTLFHVAKRQNNEYEVSYFMNTLLDMIKAYRIRHDKVKRDKPPRGCPDLRDLQGWQDTEQNNKNFINKLRDMGYKVTI